MLVVEKMGLYSVLLVQSFVFQWSASSALDPVLLDGLSEALGLQRLAIICR